MPFLFKSIFINYKIPCLFQYHIRESDKKRINHFCQCVKCETYLSDETNYCLHCETRYCKKCLPLTDGQPSCRHCNIANGMVKSEIIKSAATKMVDLNIWLCTCVVCLRYLNEEAHYCVHCKLRYCHHCVSMMNGKPTCNRCNREDGMIISEAIKEAADKMMTIMFEMLFEERFVNERRRCV